MNHERDIYITAMENTHTSQMVNKICIMQTYETAKEQIALDLFMCNAKSARLHWLCAFL